MDIADLSALLGEAAQGATYSDIWVVLPAADLAQDGALLGEARRLADGLGCYVHALLGDETAAGQAIALGADRAHVTTDLLGYLAGQQPEFVLLPQAQATLAAQLAQRLGAGLITNTPSLEIEGETRALRGAHPAYGGQYALELEVTTPVKIATVDVRDWPAPYADSGRTGEVILSDLPAAEAGLASLGPVAHEPPAWRPLQKARTIVAVGRGVGGEAGLALARQLAEALGAEFAGDRSARDSGWIDAAHEVGVTGHEVAPDLYVALGILGDTIHNAAIAGARRVVAVHANPEAPIFKAADVGLVGEPAAIVEAVLRQL
jgi:electron transfer flavoprotein alpha subunit